MEIFQQHIILYCKGVYNSKNIDFFEGLRKIWAIRCGYDYKNTNKDVDIYIANNMYEIISQCMPNKLPYIMEIIHREVGNQVFYKPQNMTPIQAIIWEYRSLLCTMQIRERINGQKRWKWIIKLPKPKKQIFNRILRGNGNFKDYYKIIKT